MDLATLTITAAGLVARRFLTNAADASGDASWKALKRAAGRVRDLLAQQSNDDALRAYEGVEDAPDSAMRVDALGTALRSACQQDPQLAKRLEQILDESSRNGVIINQSQTGDNATQFGTFSGEFTQNFGSSDRVQGTPGRPACPKCTSMDVKRKKVFYEAGTPHKCRACGNHF